MRILVLSDSHGRADRLSEIIFRFPDIKHIFFLGDNLRDIEEAAGVHPDKIYYSVKGNCDFGETAETSGEAILGGTRIFYTHGHNFGVKYSYDSLLAAAKNAGAKIALYGHTHIADIKYEEGVYIINPGSVAQSRSGAESFCIIDISTAGILPNIIEV